MIEIFVDVFCCQYNCLMGNNCISFQNIDLARENDLASKIVADVTNELEKKGAVQSKFLNLLKFRH